MENDLSTSQKNRLAEVSKLARTATTMNSRGAMTSCRVEIGRVKPRQILEPNSPPDSFDQQRKEWRSKATTRT